MMSLESWTRPEHSNARRVAHGFLLAASAGAAGLWSVMPVRALDDRSHELSLEEQRTVALFEGCSASVVHINTSIQKEVLVHGGLGYHLDLQEIPRGSGSGFVWDEQHVVTNFHVIQNADRAVVTLSDHVACEASVVGVEPDSDVAVLKINVGKKGKPLVPLTRGTATNLQVGQRVLAIGNPFGLDQTLTSGIVSGLGRELKGVSGRIIRRLIQIDAAINPGNSGGPLLDGRGRLIGVNTMIASPSGVFSGVGFAIPVDTVARVVQQLILYGRTKRAYMGVVCAPDHVGAQISRSLGRKFDGVLILNTEPHGPADKAGLRPTQQTLRGIKVGDEILAINGKHVSTVEALMGVVEEHSVGDTVEVTFRRFEAGHIHEGKISIKFADRPGHVNRHDQSGQGQTWVTMSK